MNFQDTFQGRPNTIRTYKSLFNKYIMNNVEVPKNWELWHRNYLPLILKDWNSKNLSKNTQITLVRILKNYIEFLGGPKIDSQKIIKSLERSEQQKEVVALSAAEAQRLIKFTKENNPKFYPVLLLALHAGLRRGEIFGLTCGDIDMLHGRIKVSHSYNGPTKNGKSRVVPLSNKLSRALTSARNLLLRPPDEKIFEQFDPNPVLKGLCKRANVRKIRFHDLRHTFASLALNNRISFKQVSTWLGHSSVSTTLNLYWNLTNEKADLSFLPE